jgi:hypothetical protein
MKYLILQCRCGATRKFRGENADEIIRQIDSTEWRDTPDGEDDYCPECDALEVVE